VQDKYKDKGVVLVALTDEPIQAVSRLMTSMKINYLVGTQAARTREDFGSRGFPTVFVIDPDGKVVFWGNSAQGGEATVNKLLREKPPKLARSVATRYVDDRIAKANALVKENKHIEALREYQGIVADFGDAPVAKEAARRIDAMRSDPNLAALIQQAERAAKHEARCNKLLHLARALANAGHGGQAVHYYDQVTNDCDDTAFAKLAVSERASLYRADPPMPAAENKPSSSQ